MYCLPLSYGNNGLYKADTRGKKCAGTSLNALGDPPFSANTHEFGTANELTHTERKRRTVRIYGNLRKGGLSHQSSSKHT